MLEHRICDVPFFVEHEKFLSYLKEGSFSPKSPRTLR